VSPTRSILSLMKSVHRRHRRTYRSRQDFAGESPDRHDADRLEEEKTPWITIDIGLCPFRTPAPDGSRIRLVSSTSPATSALCGTCRRVGGIDLVLLVIAADEGSSTDPRTFRLSAACCDPPRHYRAHKIRSVDTETLEVVRLEWKITCADLFSIRLRSGAIAHRRCKRADWRRPG